MSHFILVLLTLLPKLPLLVLHGCVAPFLNNCLLNDLCIFPLLIWYLIAFSKVHPARACHSYYHYTLVEYCWNSGDLDSPGSVAQLNFMHM